MNNLLQDPNLDDFKKWPKTPRLLKELPKILITEKIDGTNGQILFTHDGKNMRIGSRNRWLSSDKDNYGFNEFCNKYYNEIYNSLGIGRHYGEFAGPGIQQNPLHLENNVFFTFNPFIISSNLQIIRPVPVLYCGSFSWQAIYNELVRLEKNGSRISSNCAAEGIIVTLNDHKRYKLYCGDSEKFRSMYIEN